MKRTELRATAFAGGALALLGACGESQITITASDNRDLAAVVAASQEKVPTPPWAAGDERGMANTLGPGTWER
ncbi:MAG: hypothetical protein Tsb0010_10640 [Parvularculaceae bacterium]